MPRCSFCGETLVRGTGKMFVHTDGRIAYYCSSKCERNMLKLRRNPSHIKWTKKYEELKGAPKAEAKQAPKPEKKEEKPKAAQQEKKEQKKEAPKKK